WLLSAFFDVLVLAVIVFVRRLAMLLRIVLFLMRLGGRVLFTAGCFHLHEGPLHRRLRRGAVAGARVLPSGLLGHDLLGNLGLGVFGVPLRRGVALSALAACGGENLRGEAAQLAAEEGILLGAHLGAFQILLRARQLRGKTLAFGSGAAVRLGGAAPGGAA